MKKQAFTLVELIVVVTILAILATIGFVSYSGYLTGVRDTNRIASLTSISDGLELYRTKNDLPNPDDGINIQIEGTTIANQGYVGVNVLQTIEYSKAGKDPKDDSYYSYYLTDDKKHYQLMAFLEETENLESYSVVGKTNAAVNYSNRYPKVYGKKLGILTDSNNTPVQEITTSSLNFTGGTTAEYIARFSDSDNITASGITLNTIAGNASCKRIKELKGSSKDGIYSVNPTGTGAYDVYCDMTTDGGGFQITTMLAGTSSENLFETNASGIITSIESNIKSQGRISESWRDLSNKDIMIQCFSDQPELIGYNSPFIIYDYLKSDIVNLTKAHKQGTTFSSTNLKGKWKNNTFILNTLYQGSSNNATLSLLEAGVSTNLTHLYASRKLRSNNTFNPRGPGYHTTGIEVNTSTTTYCITGLR